MTPSFSKPDLAQRIESKVVTRIHTLLNEDMTDSEVIRLGRDVHKIVMESLKEAEEAYGPTKETYPLGCKQSSLNLNLGPRGGSLNDS